MKTDAKFLPVLLGNDINVYSMARAFHEEYGTKSIMVAKSRLGVTGKGFTNLFIYIENPKLDEVESFRYTMTSIKTEYGGKYQLILIGCTDEYVRIIAENKAQLQNLGYIVLHSDKDIIDKICLKENFYSLCERFRVEYPATFIFKPYMGFNLNYNFPYPLILKPSDSVDYNKHRFEGFQKTFIVNSQNELNSTLKLIYDNGYSGNMIIQERVPGPDSNEYDLQMYFGSDHKAKLLCLGNVLLGEHTPTAIGNNAATLNVYNEKLSLSIAHMLEGINYEGFADADIKFDPRDGIYKVLEVNIRQGRSNYRVTGAGYNLAKYVVDDYLLHKKQPLTIVNEPYFWTVVPLSLVYTFVRDRKKLAQVKKLVRAGKVCNSTDYKEDITIKRWFYLKGRALNFYKKFLKYYPR